LDDLGLFFFFLMAMVIVMRGGSGWRRAILAISSLNRSN
jgi:hypothetical protein